MWDEANLQQCGRGLSHRNWRGPMRFTQTLMRSSQRRVCHWLALVGGGTRSVLTSPLVPSVQSDKTWTRIRAGWVLHCGTEWCQSSRLPCKLTLGVIKPDRASIDPSSAAVQAASVHSETTGWLSETLHDALTLCGALIVNLSIALCHFTNGAPCSVPYLSPPGVFVFILCVFVYVFLFDPLQAKKPLCLPYPTAILPLDWLSFGFLY